MISIKKFKKFVDDSYLISELNTDDIKLIIDKISEDCKEYISLFKENRNDPIILYRGETIEFLETNKNIFDIKYFKKIKTLKDRKPKDMPLEIHSLLNKLFSEKFGINLRSESVFCSTNITISSVYGEKLCVVFPIGEFKYFWNPKIEDLYQEIDYLMSRWYWSNDSTNKFIDKEISAISNIVDGYIDNNISKANEHEIMVACDEYYIVSICDISEDKYDISKKFVDTITNLILKED